MKQDKHKSNHSDQHPPGQESPPVENESTQAADPVSRRGFFAKAGAVGTALAVGASSTALAAKALDDEEFQDGWNEYFQDHYQRMTKEEIEEALARLQRSAKRNRGVNLQVGNDPPMENVLFGYALNISKCKGYRKCVYACVDENNITRKPHIHYIRVLEMNKGSMDLEESDHYYNPEFVPQKGKFYLPVQCHHCENPPCVRKSVV